MVRDQELFRLELELTEARKSVQHCSGSYGVICHQWVMVGQIQRVSVSNHQICGAQRGQAHCNSFKVFSSRVLVKLLVEPTVQIWMAGMIN